MSVVTFTDRVNGWVSSRQGPSLAEFAKGAHSPKGGVEIGGTFFPGGQFIPAEVLAKANPVEKALVAGKKPPTKDTVKGKLTEPDETDQLIGPHGLDAPPPGKKAEPDEIDQLIGPHGLDAPPAKPVQPTKVGTLDVRKVIDRHGGASKKAIDRISGANQKHLASGGQISLWFDGKETPITSVKDGQVYDAKGQPHGLLPLAMGTKGTKNGVEFKPAASSQPDAEPKQAAAAPAAAPAEPKPTPAAPAAPQTQQQPPVSQDDIKKAAKKYGIHPDKIAELFGQPGASAEPKPPPAEPKKPPPEPKTPPSEPKPPPEDAPFVHPEEAPTVQAISPTVHQANTLLTAAAQHGASLKEFVPKVLNGMTAAEAGDLAKTFGISHPEHLTRDQQEALIQQALSKSAPTGQHPMAKPLDAKRRLNRLPKAARPQVKSAAKALGKFANDALKAASAAATGLKLSKSGVGNVAHVLGTVMGYASKIIPGARLGALAYLWASGAEKPAETVKRAWNALGKASPYIAGASPYPHHQQSYPYGHRPQQYPHHRAGFADTPPPKAEEKQPPPGKGGDEAARTLAERVAQHEQDGKLDWYTALVLSALDQTHDLAKAIESADAAMKVDPGDKDHTPSVNVAESQKDDGEVGMSAGFVRRHAVWTAYVGPHGGRGWKNTVSGLIKYGSWHPAGEIGSTPDERDNMRKAKASDGKEGYYADLDARHQADLAAIESAGLNDWPKMGPVGRNILGMHPDTKSLYTKHTPDGWRVYTDARKQLHDEITSSILAKGQADHAGVKKVLFLAGGAAVGKTSTLATHPDMAPPGAVMIDPDAIKGKLPEYQEMLHKDAYAGTAAHNESSDVARRVQVEATKLGLPLVIDSSGDGEPGKFAQNLKDMHEAGYEVSVVYVNTPTDHAVVRAVERAKKSGRLMPIPRLREQHRRVAANYPDVSSLPFLKSVQVWDNTAEVPVLVAAGSGGKVEPLEHKLYQQFLEKAHA